MSNRDIETELAESDDLRNRMSQILRDTADALHGGPLEDGLWSWHDLPALATQQHATIQANERAISDLQKTVESLQAYITDAEKPISDNPNRDAAYVTMVKTARAMGMTPLDPESFKKEDRRMLTDWQRRRMGIDKAEEEFRKQYPASKMPVFKAPSFIPTKFPFWTRVRLAWRVLRGQA